jgi:hypothetical protein
VIDVDELTVKEVAYAPPKVTAEIELKFEPLMFTDVPPFVPPLLGVTLDICGAELPC